MLTSFKTRPLSSGTRTVPYGGLGGCVELKNDSLATEPNLQHEMGRRKSRKRPLPIQIHTRDVPRASIVSPVSRLDAPLPATPVTPPDVSNLPTPAITEYSVKTPSAYDLWDRCKDNPWLATVPRKDHWSITPIRRQQTLPIELPGSLLLPSQGFAQSNPPSTPPRLTKSVRRGTNLSISSPLPSLTYSNQTTPDSRDERISAFSSPLDKELPRLPPPEVESSNKVLKPFCLMSMAQLLRLLPTLQADEITDQWIMVAEREFAKLRGFVFAFSASNNAHQTALPPFCKEVRRFLKQAQVVCETHTAEFKRAQESTDANNESDLLKITTARNQLCQAMASLPSSGSEQKVQHAEFVSIKTILLNSIQVTSGVVRNQMTFQLHKQCGGLSDPLVHLLRHFDNGIAMKRKSYLDCVVESDDARVDHMSEEQSLIEPVSSSSSTADNDHLPVAVGEIEQIVNGADTNDEVEYLEPQAIIESYFDQVSIISHSSDYTTDKVNDYSDQISDLEKEFEFVRQSIQPQSYSQHQYQHQTPSAPPTPLHTPPPLPHPVAAPHSHRQLVEHQQPLPPSPPISPIQMPTTPPPTYTQPSPSHALESLQDHYNLEIATRNSQIDDLRCQIQSLEAHNDLLREHIEGFVQLQHGETGSGKGGFRFSVAALKMRVNGNGNGVTAGGSVVKRSERSIGRRAVSTRR